MNSRLLLALFIAVVPISVDMNAPPDSARARAPEDTRPHEHETRVTAAGSNGQFAIVHRGCSGEVIDVAKTQLRSGALELEHVFPNDLVLGVRGGSIGQTAGRFRNDPLDLPRHVTGENVYFNPYLGYDDRHIRFGAGWMHADEPFPFGERPPLRPDVSGHFEVHQGQTWSAIRYMEDLPLESEGYLTVETGFQPKERLEAALFLGMLGPWDGAMLGVKGRVWVTPEAALLLRVGFSQDDEFSVGAGLQARLGKH
ncbi:MAG: hypothetical protein HZA61_00720 [Candidatus Eisenbacteria bacterium]|uniref:Uncharacterized protein n=1 Tax=Eiseniibacteriota bacterium TaxID=2212470 RepID=A0A933S8R4_UNCEI|nr:hypothetical protein [Candidatus Eisenbacteria bacterium]